MMSVQTPFSYIQIPADAKLLIGNYSKQKEEMLQAYEARVYAYHL